jgi:pilus assembly protein Flp/PilA
MGASMRTILRFLADDSAATAIEYAMIAAGIAVAIVSVVQGLGSQVNSLFTSVSTAMK